MRSHPETITAYGRWFDFNDATHAAPGSGTLASLREGRIEPEVGRRRCFTRCIADPGRFRRRAA